MADLSNLPAGLSARPLGRADVPAAYELTAAHEAAVLGDRLVDLEDLEGDWARPSFDPGRDTIGVYEDDVLVAYGEIYRARRAEVHVHPDAWGRGIGLALVEWSERLAAEQGGQLIGQSVSDADAAAALFEGRGYRRMWSSWVLRLPADKQIPPSPLPVGYAIREFRPGHDEQATYQVVEDAFSEWPDRDPSAYEDWAATVLGRPGFAPWQLLLAVRDGTDQVVGVCLLVLSGDTGWISQLAVARAHRGQRLGQSLLAAAFASARGHGVPHAELSTDSRTGALDLYLNLGMVVTQSFTHWAREVAASG